MADEPNNGAAPVPRGRLTGTDLIDVAAECHRADRVVSEAGCQLDAAGGADRSRLLACLERHFIARVALNRTVLERIRELK